MKSRPMKVLWALSTVGTGHVHRDIAISRELRKLVSPVDIRFVSGGAVPRVLEAEGIECEDALPAMRVPTRDGWADLLGFVPNWFRNQAAASTVLARIVERDEPDLVVSDELPCAIGVAGRRGVPCAYLTDVLDFGFGRPVYRYPVYNLLYLAAGPFISRGARRLYERSDLVLLLAGAEAVPGRWRRWASRNVQVVGPVVRKTRVQLADLRNSLGLPRWAQIVVVTAGGSASGFHLLKTARLAVRHVRERRPDVAVVIVTGPEIDPARIEALTLSESHREQVFVKGFIPDLVNYFQGADLVVCHGGQGTLMEAVARGRVPVVCCPIGGHWEEEASAFAAQRAGYGRALARLYLSPRRLGRLVATILTDDAARKAMIDATFRVDGHEGAARAAGLIASLPRPEEGPARVAVAP